LTSFRRDATLPDRFYCPTCPNGGRVSLDGDEARHLALVTRHKTGDRVEIFDGRGTAYEAEVLRIDKDRVALAISAAVHETPPPCAITLATAVPKGDRFDWLVEKTAEIGVERLVPIVTERSVVDPRPAKLDRLRRRAIETAKQCGRSRLLEIDPPIAYSELLQHATAAHRLMAHPGGLVATCWLGSSRPASVVVAIGPEGGFTDEETALAKTAGWTTIGLGPYRLRIETAGVAVCATVLAMAAEESR
jgi:16S rRNA (uracil1498-N3)-methyltransferase